MDRLHDLPPIIDTLFHVPKTLASDFSNRRRHHARGVLCMGRRIPCHGAQDERTICLYGIDQFVRLYKRRVGIMSFYTPVYALYGTDGILHLAEEMKDPATNAPVCIPPLSDVKYIQVAGPPSDTILPLIRKR